MTHRTIEGLIWARQAEEKPAFVRKSRARGAKALGLRYESALAKRIPGAKHGQWYQFQDKNGLGWCQPDFVAFILEDSTYLVLECKHTWTAEGHSQLEKLYLPVLKMVDSTSAGETCEPRRFLGIQVCKHLAPGMQGIEVARNLGDAYRLAGEGARVAWHWIGGVPVRAPCGASHPAHLAGA